MKGFIITTCLIGALIVFHGVGGFDYQRAATADEVEQSAAKARAALAAAEACKTELRCWAEKHIHLAAVKCRRHIERSAKYQAEWTGSWYEPTFSHYRWSSNSAAGRVTYIGDRVKFQNGFGAWSPMVYECVYNPAIEDVADVRVQAGRL